MAEHCSPSPDAYTLVAPHFPLHKSLASFMIPLFNVAIDSILAICLTSPTSKKDTQAPPDPRAHEKALWAHNTQARNDLERTQYSLPTYLHTKISLPNRGASKTASVALLGETLKQDSLVLESKVFCLRPKTNTRSQTTLFRIGFGKFRLQRFQQDLSLQLARIVS